MFQLYFSLSTDFLFLALQKNNQLLESIQKKNPRLHSENFFLYLQQILTKNKASLPEIKIIYFTSTPGGQTGIRISLAFVVTFQVLNPQVKLYHINTLYLQAGNKNCLSLLTIDRRERKYHAAVYQQKNVC